MTEIIVNLIGIDLWITIFLTCLWIGLLFLLIVLFTTFHVHHTDLIHDAQHPELHPHIELTHDTFDHSIEHDFDTSSNIDLLNLGSKNDIGDFEYIQSRYWLGNVSVYLLFFGQVGWFNIHRLGDLGIFISILGGYVAAKIFSWFIANYTKTVIVPIHHITRGDIGKVLYGIDFSSTGIIHVTRRDGIISPVMGKGAFPIDIFESGELGYIWSKTDGIYTLTKGRFEEKLIDKKKINQVAEFEE